MYEPFLAALGNYFMFDLQPIASAEVANRQLATQSPGNSGHRESARYQLPTRATIFLSQKMELGR